jgi:hypothetical protein
MKSRNRQIAPFLDRASGLLNHQPSVNRLVWQPLIVPILESSDNHPINL